MKEKRIIIKGGTIIDGSGTDGYLGDILVEDNIIKEISRGFDDIEGKVIDASGKVVTPGFFDSHRHCDYALMDEQFGKLELAQGITSTVTGSCGLTPFPLPENPEYRKQLDDLLDPCLGHSQNDAIYGNYQAFANYLQSAKLPMNIGALLGSCSLRIGVKGFDASAFTEAEMKQMQNHVEEAMEYGAIGLSMGLMYYPEYYSSKAELTRIAKFAASYDGILTCHIRGEGDGLIPSLEEIIEVAERAEIPLQISHLKSCGVNNWGKDIYRAIDLIDCKRNQGVDVMVDFYPYHGGSTTLMSLIPPTFMKETLEETWAYMSSAKGVADLRKQLSQSYERWDNYILSLGYDKILISSCALPHNQRYIGKSIAQIETEYGVDSVEFICRLMAEENGKIGIIVMSMSAADVDEVAKLSYSYLISDGLYSDAANPHPRLYGAFPRMIRDFVLERKVLTLAEGIKKMTSMPAKRMKIPSRGLLQEGFFADINIFSPENFKDNATFEKSRVLATGMDYVILNGQVAWEHNQMSDLRSGKFLRRDVL